MSTVRPMLRRLASAPVVRRHLSSAGGDKEGMFYNSQQGRWMRKSGAAGIRIHEVGLTLQRGGGENLGETFRKICAVRPLTVQLPPVSELLQAHDVAALLVSSAGTGVVSLVSDQEELGKWAALRDSSREAELWAGIELSCQAQDLTATIASARSLVSQAKAMGLQVKARLHDGFATPEGESGPEVSRMTDAAMALADEGADAIVVSDAEGAGALDESELTDALEALLWFDVAGESMMERLAYSGPLAGCLCAAEVKVTHFEAAAFGARGLEAPVVDLRRLIEHLRQAGKEVSVDHDAIAAL
mmetsp:Transcript_53599/g.126834  ORF Transcript_53599/g.126834 Transcript_53599/m.126834 type:complete len:302 (+) Transcript_53599:55-960(+)